MICPCCAGDKQHSAHNTPRSSGYGPYYIDCGPCNGTGEIPYHGVIEVGAGVEVEWSGDMPSAPLMERFYKLERALKGE